MKKIGMTVLAAVAAVMVMAGCASIQKGDLSIRTLGLSKKIVENASWMRTETNGAVEALQIQGAESDATESVHTLGNLGGLALGALIGSGAGPVGTGTGAAIGVSATEIWQTVQDLLTPATTPAATVPAAESSSTAAALWPAYRFDSYFGHGYGSEDSDRETAIAACRAAGLDCIRCKGTDMDDNVAVHILHYRSPEDGEFKLGSENWYTQALAAGVKRYQIAISSGLAARWDHLTTDYPEGSVQFVVPTAEVEATRKLTKRPVVGE